jgi:hypothetical protein
LPERDLLGDPGELTDQLLLRLGPPSGGRVVLQQGVQVELAGRDERVELGDYVHVSGTR